MCKARSKVEWRGSGWAEGRGEKVVRGSQEQARKEEADTLLPSFSALSASSSLKIPMLALCPLRTRDSPGLFTEENIQTETRATPLAVHLFSSALNGVWSSFFSFLWLDHHSVQWACRPLFFSPSLAEGEGGDVLSAGGVGSIPQRNAPQLLQRAVEKAPRLFQLHEKFPANENSGTFLFQI